MHAFKTTIHSPEPCENRHWTHCVLYLVTSLPLKVSWLLKVTGRREIFIVCKNNNWDIVYVEFLSRCPHRPLGKNWILRGTWCSGVLVAGWRFMQRVGGGQILMTDLTGYWELVPKMTQYTCIILNNGQIIMSIKEFRVALCILKIYFRTNKTDRPAILSH